MSIMVPQTGLIGSEQALIGGFEGANASLNKGANDAYGFLGNYSNNLNLPTAPTNVTLGSGVTDPLTQASNQFTGYVNNGTAASNIQADLSGANGVPAQQAAFANYQNSPAMQYQMDQVIKNRERSAAAKGGLFSGNTGLALNQDLAGVLSQNYQQDFNNLGTIANQGLSAAGQVSGLKSNEANIAGNLQQTGLGIDSQLAQQKNSIQANIAAKLAEISTTTGQNQAQLYSQTGQQLGAGRTNAGLAIAQNASDTAKSISSLLEAQGMNISNSMASDITTISNLLHESGLQDSADAKTLAQILANISGGQATNIQQGYQNVGNAQAAGILGVNNALQGGVTNAIATGLI